MSYGNLINLNKMDIEKFNREASEIFEKEVKPQINNAMKQKQYYG